MDNKFELISEYKPSGDQPRAIDELCKSIDEGNKNQVLLGVTGSGKTFTMANVIARENKPTLKDGSHIYWQRGCKKPNQAFPKGRMFYSNAHKK